MTTMKQKTYTFLFTRVVVFVLGVLSLVLDHPVGTFSGILGLFVWLWMPAIVHYELKLIDYIQHRRSK